ncbi:ROK family transcriptional regulator [Microlunatus soli]|uniref:Sugar kinase of the NBD/HSP70 family, may contain an N-terminal HTH domain n=1 Tax=Microlunatus soli TaxID=630515 RepID=A0A1H1Z0E7_9ACTN|nr:ROK family transcriptional regulator [Microlunatus soli]SDT27160.1 Sugar kinase of the NBD/HSP70 family, may contain an N-terminal HTH domain [Microlunatus soli]
MTQADTPESAAGDTSDQLPDPSVRAGWNQYDLGSFNESTIVEAIRQAGVISRTEIARQTGLTQQSVSRILRLLIQRGLVTEQGTERSNRLGKPRTPVRLRSTAAHAAGVLVDPELVTVVLADLEGDVTRHASRELPSDCGPDDLVGAIADLVTEIRRASTLENFLGVGLAVPGPITQDGGFGNLPLQPRWRNLPLRAQLAAELGCPVVVEKDGTAAAIGERWIGRSSLHDNMAYLYIGTGVGSGLIIQGEAHRGVSANAGEFGQLCAVAIGELDENGRPRLVRECNPALALPAIAAEHGYRGPDNYHDLCAAVGSGDTAAVEAAQQIAGVIARGATALVDLLDLPLVVIGGPLYEPELRPTIRGAVEHAVNSWPTAHDARQVRVTDSRLGSNAAAIGAASTIFHLAFTARPAGRGRS